MRGDIHPEFLKETFDCPGGVTYKLLTPLTDHRKCHDGTPTESRILFTCKQIHPVESEDEYVVKVKIQVLDENSKTPSEGPSTTTAAELDVLGRFRDANSVYTPHLVTFAKSVQGSNGPLPGGFITYLVMTKMPGQSLFNLQYWNQSAQERDVIVDEFMRALKWIYAFGIEPLDCGLRNVLWEPTTKKCTIIDFELWQEATGPIQDRTKELQRWALARRPPPKSWWAEWNMQGR